jgi:hypothetical protein
MKKCLLLILAILGTVSNLLNAQNNPAESDNSTPILQFSSDLSSALKLEPYLGASATKPYGKYIDYLKSFHNVDEDRTVFKGAIQPLVMATAGVQVRYMPFADCVLEKLGISLGFQYLQKGFINQFKLTYTGETNYTDVTEYREIYRHNYLAIPLQFRWGTKWFVTFGPTFTRHFSSSKTQKLEREQSGSGSLSGGFKASDKDKKKILDGIIRKKQNDFSIGAGVQFNDNLALAARFNLGGKVLYNDTQNYRTLMLELSFYKSFEIIQF